MSGPLDGPGQVKNNAAIQTGDAGIPAPGGQLTLPTGAQPSEIMRILGGIAGSIEGLNAAEKSAYVQAIIDENGGMPEAGQTIELPSLKELRVAGERNSETAADQITRDHQQKHKTIKDNRGHPAFNPHAGNGVAMRGSVGGRKGTHSATGSTEVRKPNPVLAVEPTKTTLINPQVEAGRLESALRRGDMETVEKIFYGRNKKDQRGVEEQRAIIAAFDARPFAADTEVPVLAGNSMSATGMLANWVQRKVGATCTQHNDFHSRMERMEDRQRAKLVAYLENPGSQLEQGDKIYLSLRGFGTYEEGVFRQLRGMTRAQIEAQALKYARRYHGIENPSTRQAMAVLEDDLKGDLSDTDEVQALLLLRGKDNITDADREAVELHRYAAGQAGTEEEPIFRLLEGKSSSEIRAIATAYANLPGVNDTLFDDLDGDMDGVWYKRMEAAYQGNDAPKDTRARYVAHSAELYLRGKIEWDEMARVLNRHVDPTGKNGPSVEDVERAFTKAGYWGDMTQRMSFTGGQEVRGLIEVLEAGDNVRNSPKAKAIRFYHMTEGQTGTDEKGACELLANTTASERRAIDREIRAYSRARGKEYSLEQIIRRDFADSPRWLDRALDHAKHGALPAESLLFHVSRGAGEGREVVRAIAHLPAKERAAIKQRFVEKYCAPKPPRTQGPAPADITPQQRLGADARWGGLIEQMEAGFRKEQAKGHGLNSLEGRDAMMRMASTFGVQLGVDILRTQGEAGVEALAARPNLEREILQRLQAANIADQKDGRIRPDNLQRIARHIAGVIRGEWPEFDRAVNDIGDREGRSVCDLIAAGNIAKEGLEGLKARVGKQIKRERGGSGWNAASGALMDKFGWTGEFAEEAARDFFLEVERAGADGKIHQDELQRILNRYSEFLELVKEYQAEKDQVGEVAGDIAAAAAATIVTIVSGGSAAPLVVTIAAAGAGGAKVATEKAFRGGDYQLGSAEFWKDLAVGGVDGAVTVYTAGMSKTATGAKFLRGIAIETKAGIIGGATAGSTRTALEESTWEDGFGEGLLRVGESGILGGGVGGGSAGTLSFLIRTGTGGLQRLRMRGAEKRAGRALGHGKVTSNAITDSHGHGGDVVRQLEKTNGVIRHGGDVIDKADNSSWQVGVRGGSRNVIRELRKVEPPGGRLQINVGNHEEVLFAAIDDPNLYDDVARASLNKDVALRRLLGKPSTNFARSVLHDYQVTGTAQMGRQIRRELGTKLRNALQEHGDQLTSEGRRELMRAADAFIDTSKALKMKNAAVLEYFDEQLGALIEATPELSRRDALMLFSAAASMSDADIAAKRIFLAYCDVAGDMTKMRGAMAELAQEYGLDATTVRKHMGGLVAMSRDFKWLEERMVAFQIDPKNGALMVHAGWPYTIDKNGRTVLEPRSLLRAQRLVEKRRWLASFSPEELHNNPSWAGESIDVNRATAGGDKIERYGKFSFERSDIDAGSYERAMNDFNEALLDDPKMMRSLGLDPKDFGGAKFLATGHEQLRPKTAQWIRGRARSLMARGVPKEQAWRRAGAEFATQAKLSAVGTELDRLRGWHVRMDWGLEDARFVRRQPGGRFEFYADGSFRIRKVVSSVEGVQAGVNPSHEVAQHMANETLTLNRAGTIELPVHVRAREVGRFEGMLRRAGIAEEDVTRILHARYPGKAANKAMEQFVVDFYRVAGRNEADLLDSIAAGFGRDPTRAAVEMGSPLEAFCALTKGGISPREPMEKIFAGAGRIDMGHALSREQLLERIRTVVRQNPGSRIISKGIDDVVVEMVVDGIPNTVVFQTDRVSPWVAFTVIPGTVGTTTDAAD